MDRLVTYQRLTPEESMIRFANTLEKRKNSILDYADGVKVDESVVGTILASEIDFGRRSYVEIAKTNRLVVSAGCHNVIVESINPADDLFIEIDADREGQIELKQLGLILLALGSKLETFY